MMKPLIAVVVAVAAAAVLAVALLGEKEPGDVAADPIQPHGVVERELASAELSVPRPAKPAPAQQDEHSLNVNVQVVHRADAPASRMTAQNLGVTIPLVAGSRPDEGRSGVVKSMRCGDMLFEVHVDTNSLRLVVNDAKTMRPITVRTYEFDTATWNDFGGGYGFTGLNSVFHPTTEMELLFWCQVRETTPVGISRTDDEIDGPVLEQLRSEPAPARPDGEATC